ncbi:hypothetical protein GCM10010269_04590 [Streptomyces humidus]|uniref:Uncharacterized protein n=1 Tax=Streptomyces humidus TaxID=52259 RepID=A0A918FQP1_9ACTN|nr:hypothetical protein [Streptomyces humidus]GGR68927.1 hypothetical protein GCM10010269_04590 [Streptomyces humidus]
MTPALAGPSAGGCPVSGSPVSGSPVSGCPVSGSPVSGCPVSGCPSRKAPADGASIDGEACTDVAHPARHAPGRPHGTAPAVPMHEHAFTLFGALMTYDRWRARRVGPAAFTTAPTGLLAMSSPRRGRAQAPVPRPVAARLRPLPAVIP